MAGRRLTYGEREEIAWRRDRSQGVRQIARALGRAPSTTSSLQQPLDITAS